MKKTALFFGKVYNNKKSYRGGNFEIQALEDNIPYGK